VPDGYRITPNHLGYDYLGQRLATWGYVVVSINANRGVNGTAETVSENDPSNIKRRGRLIMRHLQELGKWNANGGAPSSIGFEVKGKLDFSRIALFGHSRGGDAIVAADALFPSWRDRLPANSRFRSLIAIAPTDRQNPPVTVLGTAHAVLLPMCDADVFGMEGMRFYDRAVRQTNESVPSPKATFAVWGANHNHYNTEWHTADTYDLATNTEKTHGCPGQTKIFVPRGRSEEQKRTALYFVTAVVRGTLATPSRPHFMQLVDPSYDLPPTLAATSRFDRGYLSGVRSTTTRKVVDLVTTTASPCSTKGSVSPGIQGTCANPPEHQAPGAGATSAVRLRWGPPLHLKQPHYYLSLNPSGASTFSLTGMKTLEMRIGPDCNTNSSNTCIGRSPQPDGIGSQISKIAFQDTANRLSAWVPILNHNAERRPAVGLTVGTATRYHALMSSVRLPLSAFGTGFDATQISTSGWIWARRIPQEQSSLGISGCRLP
jgi:hypothetical protein